jgi:hypothetical protein
VFSRKLMGKIRLRTFGGISVIHLVVSVGKCGIALESEVL